MSCRLWEPTDAEWSCASRNDEAEGSVAPGLTSNSSFSRSSLLTSSLYERIDRAVVSSLSLRRSICARACRSVQVRARAGRGRRGGGGKVGAEMKVFEAGNNNGRTQMADS